MKKNVKTTPNNKKNNKVKPDILAELLILGAVLINMSPDLADIVGRAFEEIERLRKKITKLETAKNARN